MQLLRAAFALSAIPSSGALATPPGNAAPLGALPKSMSNFLHRDDQTAELAGFNEEAEAIYKKIDTLELQCKMMQIKDEDTLSGLNRELRAIGGQLAGNIALESGAASQAKQERAQTAKLKESLGKTKEMCQMQQKHLDTSVVRLKKDQKKAKALRALSSSCGEAALAAVHASVSATSATSTSFLQGCGEEVTTPMRAAVTALEQEADFDTEFAKQAFSNALKHASAGSTFLYLSEALLASDKAWPAKSKPASAGKAKAATACSLGAGSPNCALLKSQLDTMAQHLEEQKDAAVTNQRKQVEDCLNGEKEMNERIKSTDTQYARTSAELVRLTGLKAGFAASRASIQGRLERTERDAKKSRRSCKDGISEYKGELDEILGKRQAAANAAAGKRVIIQDCMVTDWVASKCSTPCKANEGDAAGTMNFTRSVNQVAGLTGTSCPPFSAKLPCNDKPCPVDCAVDEWTAWGACSKACAGGTAKRNRKVVTQAKDGGKSCPGIEMRKACNVGSCSDPCTLQEWTPWSACSRRCKFSKGSAAGRQRRIREVQGNPIQRGGASSCPPAEDKMRLQTRKCNKEVCPKGVTCDASQDVLFLLDASGDPANDFNDQRALVSKIVKASSDKVHFGVLSYGKEIKVLSRITADRGQIAAMNSYAPPAGGTRDSTKGVVVGKSLFADPGIGGGRAKIAVLLLGGSPASYVNAKKASEELRSAGVRVVIGLVDSGNKQVRRHACGLASSPCSANVEAVPSWQEMAAQPRRFLSTICRDLVYPTPAPSQMDKMVN